MLKLFEASWAFRFRLTGPRVKRSARPPTSRSARVVGDNAAAAVVGGSGKARQVHISLARRKASSSPAIPFWR